MRRIAIVLCLLVIAVVGQAQYTTFEDDPLKLKQTTLKNGLTVYLIEDHNTPEVFGGLAVKAGGKYDPADATGMAHYLEHMLFKGTTTLGTTDYNQEKVYLDKIDALYDQLGQTKDEAKRTEIQDQINANSVKATEYALPNEFPNLINYMGGKNMNAYTTEDMIFFFNTFPPNQMLRFLDIYAHRMDKPVFRLFQSELETVYEEKNQRSESFISVIFETFLKTAFKNHPYGTQTVIGTTEHLKNPSLTKMYEYFNTYFVANNMALILSGDFNPDEAMPLIEKTFGSMRAGKVPTFTPPKEEPFKGRELVDMAISPIPLGVMGIRTVPQGHPDEAALEVANHLLFNQGGTGYFNVAALEQRIQGAFIFPFPVFDHGITILYFIPKIGAQKIEDAEQIILDEMKRIREGDFEEWQLSAAKEQLKMNFIRQMEGGTARANLVARTFCSGRSWQDFVNAPKEYDKVSRERIMEVAKKYYAGENYLLIASNTGSPKKDKLDKPGYKPPIPKRDTDSEYAKAFKAMPEGKPKDRFVDFETDLSKVAIGQYFTLYHVPNPLNSIFEMEIRFGYGERKDPLLGLATQYMNLVGSKKTASEEIRKQLSSKGITYGISSSDNYTSIDLSGNEENIGDALALMQELVLKPAVDDEQISQIARGVQAQHQQELQNPQTVGSALFDYARYGDKSPYMTRLSYGKAASRSAKEMVAAFKEALRYGGEVHYSGTKSPNDIMKLLENNFFSKVNPKQPATYKAMPTVSFNEPVVYFCERKDANQTQIYIYKEGSEWTPEREFFSRAFTRYFGRGFSSLVLQEIREYRSLAYNARAYIRTPEREGQKMDFYGFVSTQTDKTNEALKVFMDLITNMPQKKNRLELIQRGMEQQAYTNRPGFRRLSYSVVSWLNKGYDSDPNKMIASNASSLKWEEIYEFYQEEVQNTERPLVLAVTGDSDRFDMAQLEKIGKVVKVSEAEFMRN